MDWEFLKRYKILACWRYKMANWMHSWNYWSAILWFIIDFWWNHPIRVLRTASICTGLADSCFYFIWIIFFHDILRNNLTCSLGIKQIIKILKFLGILMSWKFLKAINTIPIPPTKISEILLFSKYFLSLFCFSHGLRYKLQYINIFFCFCLT